MARLLIVNALVWSGVAAAAAAVVDAARPDAPPPAAVVRNAATAAGETAGPAVPAPPPLSAFAAIAERPLFSPDRRPAANAPAAQAASGATPPSLALLGVAGYAADRVAIARLGEDTLRLRVGAVVDGWTVAGVEPRALTLRAGASEHRVRLGDAPPDSAGEGAAAPGLPATARPRGRPGVGGFDLDFSRPDSEQYD